MERGKTWKSCLIVLALVGMLLPAPVVQAAVQPVARRTAPADVALSADGMLRGQVLSPQGQGVPGVCVTVSDANRELMSTVSGVDGRFEIRGLKGGVLTIAAGQGKTICRAWTPKAAPPAAGQSILVVTGQSQVLGQHWGGFRNFVTNPWVIAGVVAAAIAIPVAIHNCNDDSPGSP